MAHQGIQASDQIVAVVEDGCSASPVLWIRTASDGLSWFLGFSGLGVTCCSSISEMLSAKFFNAY